MASGIHVAQKTEKSLETIDLLFKDTELVAECRFCLSREYPEFFITAGWNKKQIASFSLALRPLATDSQRRSLRWHRKCAEQSEFEGC